MADYLLTYDVGTADPDGPRRLRKVARLCEGHGLRVQKSVFELVLDHHQLLGLLARIQDTINERTDSIRVYAFNGKPLAALGAEPRVPTSRGPVNW